MGSMVGPVASVSAKAKESVPAGHFFVIILATGAHVTRLVVSVVERVGVHT